MQFMPSTAKQYGVTDLHDPYQSLKAGAEHLARPPRRVRRERHPRPRRLQRRLGRGPPHGGRPRYKETQDYVKKIQTKIGKGTRRTGPGVTSASAGKVILKQNRDGSIVPLQLETARTSRRGTPRRGGVASALGCASVGDTHSSDDGLPAECGRQVDDVGSRLLPHLRGGDALGPEGVGLEVVHHREHHDGEQARPARGPRRTSRSPREPTHPSRGRAGTASRT